MVIVRTRTLGEGARKEQRKGRPGKEEKIKARCVGGK